MRRVRDGDAGADRVAGSYDRLEDDCGFLIEATGMFPGLISAIFPWGDGKQHKELMTTFPLALHLRGARR